MEFNANSELWIYPAKHASQFDHRGGRNRMKDMCSKLGKRSSPDVGKDTKPATKENAMIAEQMRRNRMKDLCSKLGSLLPTTHPKLDICGLYEEASNYIRSLEDDLSHLKTQRDNLQAKQCEKAAKESMEAVKVDVEIHGSEVIICISSMRKPRCVWRIMQEFEEHHLDVNMSQLCTSEFFIYMNIHGRFRELAHVHDPAHLRSSLQTRLQVAY